ncbi:MAG: VWA domain-containing protein, partial [Planctomycetes bacterium]|nr:VWA domain-containing protein [Planctomycetota bacterium]
MIFGATTFLYLLPLAGLPILFHLILKQKKRTIIFSTLMFFHRVDPKLNTRRQIREWLLLALRVLTIALLLLALSRPTLRSAVGRGGKLSLVTIIDNSGSMTAGAPEGDLTKLESAKEGARKLLASLEPDAEAALVLLVEDPAVAVSEMLSADRAGLLKCLDRISPTEASGDAPRALARAFELLHSSPAGGGVVHIFTDLQQVEWTESRGEGVSPLRVAGVPPAVRGQDALATEDKGKMPSPRLKDRADRVHVFLHRIGTSPAPRGNVAVTGVQLPEQKLLVGQPYEVGLALRNNSETPAEIRLNCIDNQGARSTQNLSLQKQEATTARLPVTMNEPGYHWLKVWLEGDGFAADNTAGIGLFCEGMATVLFVGEPRQFGTLPMALSPSGSAQLTGLATKFSPSVQLGQEEAPILIVTTWDGLTAMSTDSTPLAKYIEDGGSLLVVPSLWPGSETSAIQTPTWLGAGLRVREAYKSGVRLAILSRDARFWRQMEQVVGDVGAEPVAAYAFCPLELPADF